MATKENPLWDATDYKVLIPNPGILTPTAKAWVMVLGDDKYFTDANIASKFKEAATMLASKEWTYRNVNHPKTAVSDAIASVEGIKIDNYIAWKSPQTKNVTNVVLSQPTIYAYRLSMYGHSKFLSLKPAARAFYATDTHVLFGPSTNSAAGLILCYTDTGESALKDSEGKNVDFKVLGRLAFYLKLIEPINKEKEHIKVINLKNDDALDKLKLFLE